VPSAVNLLARPRWKGALYLKWNSDGVLQMLLAFSSGPTEKMGIYGFILRQGRTEDPLTTIQRQWGPASTEAPVELFLLETIPNSHLS
jgi:hypothetical protein